MEGDRRRDVLKRLSYIRVEGSQETLEVQTLPLSVEEALFRVAQEALANVARHSNATLVQMILTITDEKVTLTIADNGQGFDTTRQRQLGVGLLSMQERMKALGGDVQVESTPGKGTRVVAYCNRLGIDTEIVGEEDEVSEPGVGAVPFNEGAWRYAIEMAVVVNQKNDPVKLSRSEASRVTTRQILRYAQDDNRGAAFKIRLILWNSIIGTYSSGVM